MVLPWDELKHLQSDSSLMARSGVSVTVLPWYELKRWGQLALPASWTVGFSDGFAVV